jgi:uncharacterized protein with HEPN domain
MLSEKDSGTLRDILRHIDLAEQFAHGKVYEDLRDDIQALYAVIRSLEIISEASRRLSDELKARHAGIPWREMAAAGNFYRHNYEDVPHAACGRPCARICRPFGPPSIRR